MRARRFCSIVLAFCWFIAAPSVYAAVYTVDPNHSTVSFKIRHLFSKVQGFFRTFEGVIEYEPGKPETWKASGTIDAASIDTNVPPRDKHLRSADFFDVEKFPKIEFKTTGVAATTADSAKLTGLINIHGVEKPITLDVAVHGVGKDPWGNVRAGFTATGTIHRKDFGLNWNEALETGQFLVGDEVMITIEAEGILKE